ncbi:hypothetical protein AAFF_G00252920 [Aldrovandia affinis]|uniref:Uncharacterized protein n=1 Tax=Aldrovandia affinis TaxID=143900 RepID=A0AAD7WTH4_9TELE|nr:hypothetical protein AAFF_G00252920 [Aldrovandia affinis]
MECRYFCLPPHYLSALSYVAGWEVQTVSREIPASQPPLASATPRESEMEKSEGEAATVQRIRPVPPLVSHGGY